MLFMFAGRNETIRNNDFYQLMQGESALLKRKIF